MDGKRWILWATGWLGVLCAVPCSLLAQGHAPQAASIQPDGGSTTASATAPAKGAAPANLQEVAEVLRQLQGQITELNQQVKDLRAEQVAEREKSGQLREELAAARAQISSMSATVAGGSTVQPSAAVPTAGALQATAATQEGDAAPALSDRVSRLEEVEQVVDGKFRELSQTKVESGSKYRLRLSGIVLFNSFVNRGTVDQVDVPEIATPKPLLGTNGSFGGTLRQSEIALEGFGPEIWGAKTSANVRFDFAGGFPATPNGVSEGIVRLRTGVFRLDWANTSIIAGQDTLFLSPLNPSSIASLAVPALAYSGNLWAWTPQVRVEHTVHFSDTSKLLIQGGILDSQSGDVPQNEYTRIPTWGEQSGQPAYATRVALTKTIFGQEMTFGAGGYYGRQDWGFGRTIDAWAGTADVQVPFGRVVEFDGQFYRGRALGGLGGGIGQSVLWNGALTDPNTEVNGLDSFGGWGQLKFRVTPKLELNGALGIDNPFADELREYNGNAGYYGMEISKNVTPMANVIYQPRSNVVLSLEYRHLKTYPLDNAANEANRVTMSIGYIF
jgi:hypothetical protein